MSHTLGNKRSLSLKKNIQKVTSRQLSCKLFKKVLQSDKIISYFWKFISYFNLSTHVSFLNISGQTLHAIAGNNCSFEERDLPNILPKLERYLPSLEATWK